MHIRRTKIVLSTVAADPLEANNADELLSVLLTDAAELGPFKKVIIGKSEGNPLFIEEIVRALFENGTIVREGEQVRVTRPHAEISIPATVEGIVAARIDRLLPEEKNLLQALAVIGEEFPLPLARHALGKPENELLQSLAAAAERRVHLRTADDSPDRIHLQARIDPRRCMQIGTAGTAQSDPAALPRETMGISTATASTIIAQAW